MPPASVPSLRRRLACFVYEGVLLFGVLMAAGIAFATLMQQRHALQSRGALMAFLFIVLGAYFVGFWSHGGQTLPMKTWRIRVERADGAPLGALRALLRYLAAWLWFVPALLVMQRVGPAALGLFGAALIVLAGVVGYALVSLLHPQRQFWHDALAGTRLVTALPQNRPG